MSCVSALNSVRTSKVSPASSRADLGGEVLGCGLGVDARLGPRLEPQLEAADALERLLDRLGLDAGDAGDGDLDLAVADRADRQLLHGERVEPVLEDLLRLLDRARHRLPRRQVLRVELVAEVHAAADVEPERHRRLVVDEPRLAEDPGAQRDQQQDDERADLEVLTHGASRSLGSDPCRVREAVQVRAPAPADAGSAAGVASPGTTSSLFPSLSIRSRMRADLPERLRR